MTLSEFLLARIAEDERNAPHVVTAQEWRPAYERGEWQAGDLPIGITAEVRVKSTAPDPRILRECEAKRRIVALHAGDQPNCMGGYIEGLTHRQVVESEALNGVPTGYCDTLRALALPYADHPDYRDEWKPQAAGR